MAKLHFGPSPWGVAGAITGGLTEGLYAGQALALRRRRQDMDEQQHQLHAALQLLGLGAKAEDPQLVGAINAMLGKVAPGLQIPAYDPQAAAERDTAKVYAQAKAIASRAGIPEGSPQFKSLYEQLSGLKADKEYTMMEVNGQMYPVEKGKEAATQLNIMKTNAYLQKLASAGGGRGGGGGAKGVVPWMDPATGKFLGYAPKLAPPTKTAVPATASSFRPDVEETPQPYSPTDLEKLGKIMDKVKKGEQLDTGEQFILRAHGGTLPGEGGSVDPTATFVPPSVTKPPKKKKRQFQADAEPEVVYQTAPAEIPPPPGFDED